MVCLPCPYYRLFLYSSTAGLLQQNSYISNDNNQYGECEQALHLWWQLSLSVYIIAEGPFVYPVCMWWGVFHCVSWSYSEDRCNSYLCFESKREKGGHKYVVNIVLVLKQMNKGGTRWRVCCLVKCVLEREIAIRVCSFRAEWDLTPANEPRSGRAIG